MSSANIKNMMASKYPTKSYEKLQADPTPPPQPSYSWNDSKILVVTVLLGVIFFIVSLPKTYQATSNMFNLADSEGLMKYFNTKLPLLHAAIFGVAAFILINIVNSV